mgnify:CR=1 FL=1
MGIVLLAGFVDVRVLERELWNVALGGWADSGMRAIQNAKIIGKKT